MANIRNSGEATRQVNTDTMVFRVTFREYRKASREALEALNNTLEEFLKKLLDLGLKIEEINQAENVIEDYYDKDEMKISASRGISFKTRYDGKLLNYVNNIVSEMDGRVLLNVSYILSNENDIKKELIKEAVNQARAKAEVVADAVGKKISSINSIDFNDYYAGTLREESAVSLNFKESKRDYISDNLSSEKREIRVNVNVDWIIE